ncbi:uncharacterized protein BJX67DRAFT_383900 [Aspergillus lucknowensis]|uniref:Uncharacterized protein n=1 Tax=Aspergillus lucknowensis TaxID=176173 RepID=A0ABR4LI56_9EURO
MLPRPVPMESLILLVFYSLRIALSAGESMYLVIVISNLIHCWYKTRQRSWAPCVPGKSLLSGRLGRWWRRRRRQRANHEYDREFEDAYNKYSKSGKAFSTTDIPGTDYFVVVPPRHCDVGWGFEGP